MSPPGVVEHGDRDSRSMRHGVGALTRGLRVGTRCWPAHGQNHLHWTSRLFPHRVVQTEAVRGAMEPGSALSSGL